MDDPFPPSLPIYESPRIYDSNFKDTMEDIDVDYYDTFTSPGNLFPDQTINDSPFPPTALKPTDNAPSNSSHAAGPDWENSPESSASSDTSNQHGRKNSNESSAMGDTAMADTPMANGILIGSDPVHDAAMDDEASNRFMASAFDFESAASSPTPILDTKTDLDESQKKVMKMPVRSVPVVKPANSFTSRSSGSSGSPEAGLSMMFQHGQRNRPNQSRNRNQLPPGASCSPSDLIMPDVGAGPSQIPQSSPWSGHSIPAVAPMPTHQLPRMPMPYASPAGPPPSPQLYISNFVAKTRVETQHMLKYTLDPLPPGISKLHLQPYTISKPKLMAKPTPARSPDMLEMFATVVCSSAMEDSTKRDRAFARARGPLSDQEEHCPSSSKEAGLTKRISDDTTEEDDQKPLNGGPVKICNGCIEREQRRAERKKIINPDEQQGWKRVEAQRTVVFNISEVREWQQPSAPKINGGKEKTIPLPYYESEPTFSPSAMQVDIPTRISCYCRHHDEKVGFRILFTIRDYQDRVIAQAMSNSIMITDDHKTHPTPSAPQHTHMAQQLQMPGVPPAIFPPGPMTYGHPSVPSPFPRNAFSATDLPRINQQYHPRLSGQVRTFPTPQEGSKTTSATLTPRNLSRPASPTIEASQQTKRRKASGSNRIRNELVMTKLPNSPTTPPSSAPSNTMAPGLYYSGTASTGDFSPNYIEAPGFNFPPSSLGYISTNPPTPMTANTTYSSQIPWNQRSQSMENLTQNSVSASSSAQPSRGPSPRMANGNPQPNHLERYNGPPFANGPAHPTGVPQHAQMLTNSLQTINTMPNLPQAPVILKITPSEGSIVGGTEVSCIGRGFIQGLEVMFGDARATTTTFWGENILICQTPPAVRVGVVAVTFKHQFDKKEKLPPEQQQHFKYTNDDSKELVKMMLNVFQGSSFDAIKNGLSNKEMTISEAENIAQQMGAGGALSSNKEGLGQGRENKRGLPISTSSMPKAETEAFLMKCLEQMDLDESLGQANLNLQGPSGQTMLHFSASLGYYRVTAGLLARGAYPDILDKNGISPLHLASLHGSIRIIKKLRSAGSDPTIRSLNGFTPADMSDNKEVQDAINALDQRARSRSAVATPITGLSRAPSVLSRASSTGEYDSIQLPHVPVAKFEDFEKFASHPVTPTQMRARSRRSSFKAEDHDSRDVTRTHLSHNASQLETQSALTAWRDQLSMQIQHFQETVHRALPPLPNLPDYQYYPVVRHISSLVPQRHTPLQPSTESPNDAKGIEYGWWELITGAREAQLPTPAPPPPPYGDLFPQTSQEGFHEIPQKPQEDFHDVKAPIMQAAVESFMDQKCEAAFDHAESSSDMGTINIGSKGMTRQDQDRLRSAHARKVKRIRKDRNFLFIWCPLLIVFILITFKKYAPLVAYVAQQAFTYFQPRFHRAVVEEVI